MVKQNNRRPVVANQARQDDNNLIIGGKHMDHKRVFTAGAADQGY